MKFAMLLVVALLVIGATEAGAQGGKIELFADATMSSCEIVDQDTMIRSVYMFHTGTTPSTGIRFKAPKPACWLGATWVGDIVPFTNIGDSQIDLSIGYGFCLEPPIYLGQVNFFATGGALPCCELVALPGLQFVFTDCSFDEIPLATGETVIINPNDSCRCQQPLATEPATWGRVKSLYRQ